MVPKGCQDQLGFGERRMLLISFLGTGDYKETSYELEGRVDRSRFIARALATLAAPPDISEVRIIATRDAWQKHGRDLAADLMQHGKPAPTLVEVPGSGELESLWELFGAVLDSVQSGNPRVLLDITHGFRMQPFFAAACVQYVQAVAENPPAIRAFYGEHRPGDAVSPIWELTPFIEVLSWSRSLMMFLRNGQAGDVSGPTERIGREMGKRWALGGRDGEKPRIAGLAQAIQDFSDDFTTIRTGALLIGEQSSASRLGRVIQGCRAEVKQNLPALAPILDQVQGMIGPLCLSEGARLSGVSGQQALVALARLYQRMGRYSEAISILREGWITLAAPTGADQPGRAGFANDARKIQEDQWRLQTSESLSISELRNDIQHAGFRQHPHRKEWFERELGKLLDEWEGAIGRSGQMEIQ